MDFAFLFCPNLITPSVVLIPAGEKKTLRSIIFASLFKQFVVILPSAGQHVQYNAVYSHGSLWLSEQSESPFSLASWPNSGHSSLF